MVAVPHNRGVLLLAACLLLHDSLWHHTGSVVAQQLVLRGSSRTRRPGVDVAARWRLDEEGQRLLQGHAFFRALAAGFAHSTSSQAAERSSMDLRTVDRFVPKCAWQLSATGQTFPLAFPDRSSVYQVIILRNLTSTRHIRIVSRFPSLRYFSLQTYDSEGLPVAGRTDHDLKPINGSNPFAFRDRHSEAASQEGGAYEVYVTLSGHVDGLGPNQMAALDPTNTSALSTCDDASEYPYGCMAVMLFRLYHENDGFDPFNTSTYANPMDAWGGIHPPQVLLGNHTQGWTEVPTCDPVTVERFTQATSTRQRRRFSNVQVNTSTTTNQANNFILPVADLGSLYANLDATYTIATSHFPSVSQDGPIFLLARITGHLPLTPTGLRQGPRFVDEVEGWEVRYVSYSVVDMEGGKATLDGVSDEMIEQFYTQRWGAEGWKDRGFSLVAAPNKTIAEHCGLYDERSSLFLSTTTPPYYRGDDVVPVLPHHLGYVRREILPSPRHPSDWRGPQDQPATSSNHTSYTCKDASAATPLPENRKGEDQATWLCYEPSWLRTAMGANYPSITYYRCNVSAPLGSERLSIINATTSLQNPRPSRA